MNLKNCGAVAAFAAVVAIAPSVSAQGTAGKGAVGGIIGVPFFLADEDTKNGQSPRILAQGQFQYAITSKTRLALSAGYGWIGYKSGTPSPYKLWDPGTGDSVQVMDDVLTKFQPISATFLRSFRAQGKGFVPYAGLGVNLTRIEIVNKRQKIKDPATFDPYVNWAPGVHAQGGFEYFLSSNQNVSFDGHGRFAKLFSKDEAQFPSGFTGPHAYFTLNFGVNVYFWPIGRKPIEVAPQPEPETVPAPIAPETSAPPDTVAPAPAPVPPPPPPPPPTPETPDTTVTPDTTRAPGSQSSILQRTSAVSAPAPSAKTKVAATPSAAAAKPADDDTTAVCPVRPASEGTSGMFGVPGIPVTPPKAEEAPPPEVRSPEGSPTP